MMFRKLSAAAAAALVVTLPGVCVADQGSKESELKGLIESRIPELKVNRVLPSEIPGWFEIVTADKLYYANGDGSLLFVGSIFETATKQDLTQRRWSDLHPIDFDSLPLNLAIKVVHGDGSRKLVVFADPLCPFCKRFEEQLQSVQNVTIYTFLHPLENLHPGAIARSGTIWCAADRAQAWTNWMLRQKVDNEQTNCDLQGLTTVRNLAAQLKVDATPTLFFEDGHRVPGVSSIEELEREFGIAHARSKKR